MKHNKNTWLIAGMSIALIIITILLSGCIGDEKETSDKPDNPGETNNNSIISNTDQNTSPINETNPGSKPGDIRIKVVKFEPNNPCQGCTNLGNFANETIQRHFLREYKSGKIIYETVNYQDAENMELVKKYNVVGSSLYIMVIKDGKEEIIDANDMWNYVWDNEEYLKIFKDKLENLKNA